MIGFFLVTWNQYELIPHYDGVPYTSTEDRGDSLILHRNGHLAPWTVEVTTHTLSLATQKDVDFFVGYQNRPCKGGICSSSGLIDEKAFNVKVKEIK